MQRTLQAVFRVSVAISLAGTGFLCGQTTSAPSTTQASPAGSQTPTTSQAAQNPAANPMVELLLKSSSVNVRARAARDLGKERDLTTVAPLAAALSDKSEKVRREVVMALAQMHNSAAVDALIRATKDSDEGVRVLAVRSLVGYYTGNVPTPGFTGFMKKNWQSAKGHFTIDTTRIDPGTIVDSKVITALDETLKSPASGHASEEAAKGLGILMAKSAVPDLVAAAHSSNTALARESLNALTKIKDKSAGPKLVDLLDSADEAVKRDAMVTVGVLRTEEALPKLQSIYETSSDEEDQEQAMQGLAYLGNKVSVPIFTKALWSNDKSIRASAAEGLARAGDPATLPEIQKALMAEKDQLVRLADEFGLTALGKMDYLSSMIDDLGVRSRADVAQPYLIELARNPKFLTDLYPYLQSRDANVRKRLCDVLMYSGDQTSLEQLDRLSHDPDGDVSAEALRAKQAIRARLASAPAPTSGTGK